MRLWGLVKNMKLNRRHFLASLIAVGATVALPVAFADATLVQINTAWKQLPKASWYVDVTEYGTIVDDSVCETKIRSDVFYFDTGAICKARGHWRGHRCRRSSFSAYYAAELRGSIEQANVRVAKLELPFRFKKRGADAEDIE